MTEEQQKEHAKNYALMLETFQKTGKYIDPVSGKEFPPGQQMLEHPNRVQRRRLDKWRETGKVKGMEAAPTLTQTRGGGSNRRPT